MSEILIICAVALLVFGPQQLPEMAKKIAKGLKEVRKASDDLKRSINLDDDEDLSARHRWKPPVPGRSGAGAPLIEPPKTQTPATLMSSSSSSDLVPPSIAGSALAVEAHHVEADPVVAGHNSGTDDEADPVITPSSSSVAIGSTLSEETTDPQKPSLKEAG